MFSLVVKWLGFLKKVPLLAIYYDSLIKLWILVANPKMLNWIDEIEAFVLCLSDTQITLHQYGGAQFNFREKEFAHLHSNGILDILLNQNIKENLKLQGRIADHHIFKNSGWISFYIKTQDDVDYAKALLEMAYKKVNSIPI